MRALSPEMARALDGAALTLATAWRITRADGVVLGFTDCDAPLAFDGVVHSPAALTGPVQAASAGLDADEARVLGAFDDARVTQSDLEAGAFDGAALEIWRVDWTDPRTRIRIYRGALGAVRRTRTGFEIEVRDAKSLLARPVGRIYARGCDAAFGDARCGADRARFTAAARVVSIAEGRTARVSGLDAFADGWFSGGVLRWGASGRARILAHRREGAWAGLDLDADALGGMPSSGVDVRVEAGCDKSFSACRGKFGNAINFRGFPHMIGTDGLIRGPSDGEAQDGRARG